jgi:hypothetical protein
MPGLCHRRAARIARWASEASDRPSAQEEIMNSFTCPRYTVSHRPRAVAIAALVVVLAVCAFATVAQAASGSGRSRGSNDAIVIEPRPLFDESELRGLIEKPSIVSFAADKTTITKGQSARLSWKVENANTVRISGFSNQWQKSGATTVKPSVKTTYRLTATNAVGTVTKSVTVNVSKIAVITGHVGVIKPVTGTVLLLENVAVNLVDKANTATWDAGRRIKFGGFSATGGWARKIASVSAEDNKNYKNVLQMQPPHKPNGFVYGRYTLTVPAKARFAATVAFTRSHGSRDGATARVLIKPTGQRSWRTLAFVKVARNGKLHPINADLKAYANQRVQFQLQVNAGRQYQDDMVLWIAPRILK